MIPSRLSLIVVLLLGVFFGPVSLAQEDISPRTNIIVIIVDDMGWGDLGLNYQNSKEGKKHSTPELDRMAQEGVRMLRHYCPAPVCAPSRSSLMSGLHQGHANVRDNQFDKALADNHTLATVLKAANYRSVLVGKYGLQGRGKGPEAPGDLADWPAYPTERGFDEFYGSVRHIDGHHHYPANRWPLGNSVPHQSPKELWHNDKEVSGGLDKCFSIDLFTAFAKKWVVDHQKDSPEQPFFMYLAHDTPHGALQLATSAYPEGRGLKGGVQWLGKEGRMINTAVGEIDSYVHPDYRRDDWTSVEQRFASMVRRLDNGVGDLLQLLRDLQIADNTLVVFTSDNGPHNESYITAQDYKPTSFRSYGRMDGMKRDVWEGGIRVPTVAWWPGAIPKGREDRRPSQFHDWLATFADVAGLSVPALSDGVSLVPQLTGRGTPENSTVYVEYVQRGKTPRYADFANHRQGRVRGQMQVLFHQGYKGVRTNVTAAEQDFEIYDVDKDPGERTNLLGTGESFEVLNEQLKQRVIQIRRSDESAQRPYDHAAVPPVQDRKVVSGLTWKIHEGSFPWVPRLADNRKPNQTISSQTVSASLPAKATSICQAYLKVPAEGIVHFHGECKGKAVVKLHQAALIDADFGYEGEVRETAIKLAAGLHPITLWVTAGDKAPELSLEWTVNGRREPIPASALFQEP